MRYPAIKLSRQSELDLCEKSEKTISPLALPSNNSFKRRSHWGGNIQGQLAFLRLIFLSVTFNRHLNKKNLLFSKRSIVYIGLSL